MKFLLLDVSYLCYRAFYSFKDLSHEAVKTGVLYGFLKELETLSEEFQSNRLLFCFDKGAGIRKEIFPEYKMRRKQDKSPEELEIILEVGRQIELLRDEILPSLGFKNIFYQDGYESDDIMAFLARRLERANLFSVIVSADADMWQMISNHCECYDPKKRQKLTKKVFKSEYGIDPKDWWKVKMIAGCKSDEVPGIKGVGELTALKYLRGELKKDSKKYQEIRYHFKKDKSLFIRNRKLVRLPMRGVKRQRIHYPETISFKKWQKVARKYGFRSIKMLNIFKPITEK